MKHCALIIVAALFALSVPAQAAAKIEEVTSPGGIHAWLVEDHMLPLISMHFAFQGGVEQDPVDKQGLANLTMSLLTQGAGPYSAADFQQQLANHSVIMHFDAGRDALYGDIKCLSAEKDISFDLLNSALTKPRFEDQDIERMRNQQLTSLRIQLGSPDWQARYALLSYIFAGHPYSERKLGTTQSLAKLTREDIADFANKHLARDNLMVAAAGDITPAELASALDRIFGELPAHAELKPVPEVTWPEKTAIILVPREGTQTELMFAIPGPKRDDPDWYAAQIANYILGGGGFSSRLMHNVRDKNGLTYGIDTELAPMSHAAMVVGEAATDNDKTGTAWTITLDTMHKFYQDGATADEINAAKDYLTGALPLSMTSTDAIAGVLIDMQLYRLGRDYLERRDGLIRSVSIGDINRTIRRWFDPSRLTLVMVGEPHGMSVTKTEAQTVN